MLLEKYYGIWGLASCRLKPAAGKTKKTNWRNKRMIPRLSVWALAFFLTTTVAVVWAQGPVGTLNGTVLDPAGAVVPGASVVIANMDTNVELKTTSTSAGAYTIPYVPSGTYRIRVTA